MKKNLSRNGISKIFFIPGGEFILESGYASAALLVASLTGSSCEQKKAVEEKNHMPLRTLIHETICLA
ncbi:MAG: hypothetical protein WD824_11930 [Cyclobacteriaceae bacterium]